MITCISISDYLEVVFCWRFGRFLVEGLLHPVLALCIFLSLVKIHMNKIPNTEVISNQKCTYVVKIASPRYLVIFLKLCTSENRRSQGPCVLFSSINELWLTSLLLLNSFCLCRQKWIIFQPDSSSYLLSVDCLALLLFL